MTSTPMSSSSSSAESLSLFGSLLFRPRMLTSCSQSPSTLWTLGRKLSWTCWLSASITKPLSRCPRL
jgi:hypothetical protein